MQRQNDNRGGEALALGLALILVLAAIGAAIGLWKVIPVFARGAVGATKASLPATAAILRRCVGWPSQVSASSVAGGSILGAVLWTLVGFLAGIGLWAVTGPSLGVVLTTTVGGAILGAAVGAASVAQKRSDVAEGLDDYLSEW